MIIARTFFIKHGILYNMSFTKSEHTIQNYVVYVLIPSFHGLRMNAWDHDLPSGNQEQLAFYDPGFPTEARVKSKYIQYI